MTCEGCFKGTEKIARSELAAKLGPEVVRDTLGFRDASVLVDGAADIFVTTAQVYGMSKEEAERMGVLIERHAAETLYNEGPAVLSFELSEEFNALRETA